MLATAIFPNNSFSDAVYKEYMTKLGGPITDEKRQFLADERAMIEDILSRKEEMQQKYARDEITYEEYYDYITKYNYASSRDEYFKIVERHAAYIDRMKAEKGLDAHFVYDTGWRAVFSGFDFTLYAAIALLLREFCRRTFLALVIRQLRTDFAGHAEGTQPNL